jgi:cell fate regulator YaaT (PSP1 superfamily)
MNDSEYLVSYGRAGDFGRFRPAEHFPIRRGDRVLIRTENGLEIGVVLCPASAGHAQFLSRTALGEILRPAGEEDEQAARLQAERGQRLFAHARRLAQEMELPLEVVDVDLLPEGRQAVVYHLRRVECDYRPLVSTLARTFDVQILMQNLALPAALAGEEEAGCGRPDCGQVSGQGCSTCSSGGCGTCGKGAKKEDVAAYLSGLRQQMDDARRTSLL